MNNKVKILFYIKIPYFINRYLEFTLFDYSWHERHIVRLSIWRVRKLIDILGYENEWGGIPLKHITFYNRKRRE